MFGRVLWCVQKTCCVTPAWQSFNPWRRTDGCPAWAHGDLLWQKTGRCPRPAGESAPEQGCANASGGGGRGSHLSFPFTGADRTMYSYFGAVFKLRSRVVVIGASVACTPKINFTVWPFKKTFDNPCSKAFCIPLFFPLKTMLWVYG